MQMSEKKRDYYEVLGLKKDATEDQIKSAYKKLALKFHPDRHANASDKEKEDLKQRFQELVEAYDVLSTPEKKTKYDQFGHTDDMNFQGFQGVDINDIFSSFFGDSGGFSSGKSFNFSFGNQSQGSPFAGFGDDFFNAGRTRVKRAVEFPLPVTIDECFSGCVKKRKITRTLSSGAKEEKILDLCVKPGYKAGTRFTYRDSGDQIGPKTFQDIVFILEVKPTVYKWVNDDLEIEREMNFTDYLAGKSLSLNLPGGREFIMNCHNVENVGTETVFYEKGMPNKNSGRLGNLRVKLALKNSKLKQPINIK
ncbi:hypothetical protein COBT_000395 [Conglomerata obtusa]